MLFLWENLKEHVSTGCLCDPPGIKMLTYEKEEPLNVGGESFRAICTQRGTSATANPEVEGWLRPDCAPGTCSL